MKEDEFWHVLSTYSQAYYEGRPIITDEHFDRLYEEFKTQFPESEHLKEVAKGFRVENTNLQKSKHLYGTVGSLEKIHSTSEFPIDKVYCASVKLDGSSLVVYYKDGYVTKALTRGDGIYGLDVTSKLEYIAPNRKKFVTRYGKPFTGAVRGEVVMSKEMFEKYKTIHPEAKMARNVSTGLLMRKDASEDLKYVDYVTYKIIADENTEKTTGIGVVRSSLENDFGYKVVNFAYLNEEAYTDKNMKKLKESEEFSMYPSDGIVLTDPEIKIENGEYIYSEIAYKFPEETKQTTVREVQWNFSPKGKLVPVVVVDPVNISGATVSKASGFNYSYIVQNKIGKGAIVELMRSGAVIPDIQNVIKPSEPELVEYCPCCGKQLTLTDSGINLICENEACNGKKFYNLYTFIEKMGEDIKGIGEALITAIISKLSDKIPDEISCIKFLKEIDDKWATDNFTPSNASKVIELRNTLNNEWDKERFLLALNIEFIGQVAAKEISNSKLFDVLFNDDVAQLAQTGLVPSIQTALTKNINRIKSYKQLNIKWRETKEVTNYVCVTGSLSVSRKEFEKQLNTMGYAISDNFDKIECLITNDVNSGSSKNKKAKTMGVAVKTEEEFRKEHNI